MSMGVIARAIGDHWVSEPDGDSRTESWCDCTCGVRITVPGGTRDQVWERGDEHQADAVADALLSDEVVERAARALYAEDVNESIDTPWPDYDSPKNVGRPLYEERARNALLAALGIEGGTR